MSGVPVHAYRNENNCVDDEYLISEALFSKRNSVEDWSIHQDISTRAVIHLIDSAASKKIENDCSVYKRAIHNYFWEYELWDYKRNVYWCKTAETKITRNELRHW